MNRLRRGVLVECGPEKQGAGRQARRSVPAWKGDRPMDPEDLEPRKQKPKPKDLDSLGVDELEEYLAELEAEAERVKQKIAATKNYLRGAGAREEERRGGQGRVCTSRSPRSQEHMKN